MPNANLTKVKYDILSQQLSAMKVDKEESVDSRRDLISYFGNELVIDPQGLVSPWGAATRKIEAVNEEIDEAFIEPESNNQCCWSCLSIWPF